MFQVDRGENLCQVFQGIRSECLARRRLFGQAWPKPETLLLEGADNIRNRDGIVFSDEYHVNSEGDPAYYMNLIMEASRKVVLTLVVMAEVKPMENTTKVSGGSSSSSASSLNQMCPVKPVAKNP